VTVRGPRELRELAGHVDDMRRDIVEQLAAVETARVEIEAARQRVEKQAAELARSNRDLEQFAYVASHDLQEPLRKVASFCQILERRYAGQLDERADQYIAFAVDGAKRMQQLINDLLAFSRVGRSSENAADVNMHDCLDSAMDNLSVSIAASGMRVTADFLPHVSGERGLLIQLLQNLIGNAIKFRSAGNPELHISAHRTGDFWEFACADNGMGIEPQYAERIFIIFQRLHGKDEYAGTGIGLALCKRIVEHHGGRIWLDTSASNGTTFRWTLPIRHDQFGDTSSSIQQEST
jgi:light-regulated signal transduction histidine kinase (bacteriophytochrome)